MRSVVRLSILTRLPPAAWEGSLSQKSDALPVFLPCLSRNKKMLRRLPLRMYAPPCRTLPPYQGPPATEDDYRMPTEIKLIEGATYEEPPKKAITVCWVPPQPKEEKK